MIPDTTTQPFLERLRFQTNPSHKKLESLPISASVVNPEITLAQYAHYLQLMRAVMLETETNVFDAVSGIVDDIERRRKLPLIDCDLENIGAAPRAFDRIFDLDQKSVGFMLGMMYTVEGSALGGRFIGKNIESALGFTEQNGARFFYGYGHATGQYWKGFLNVLVQYAANTNDSEDIIAGATYAFDAIYDHFSAQSL